MKHSSILHHRVAFHETDAIGIVHHANYLRYFENARVLWLEEHDRPYSYYMDLGLHFAVTGVQASYKRSARFDDRLEVETWVEKIRGASLRMGYEIRRDGEVLVTGTTDHAAIDAEGRPRRIPKDSRENMRAKLGLED